VIVRATHQGGYRFELRSGDRTLVSDQAPEAGGGGAGPMPGELFLWAVASCFGQAMAHVAARMRVPVEDLRVEVEGAKDERSFRFGTVTVTVEGSCEAARLQRIADLARKLCFVTNSIAGTVEVLHRVRPRP
jgi:putative redox protein